MCAAVLTDGDCKAQVREKFIQILPVGVGADLILMSTTIRQHKERQEAYRRTVEMFGRLRSETLSQKTFAIDPFDMVDGGKRFRISIMGTEQLRIGTQFLFGSLNPCCFSLGGSGEPYLMAATYNPDASFLVVEGLRDGQEEFGEFGTNPIFMEMLCWRSADGKTLVLDTIDAAQKRKTDGKSLERPVSFLLSSDFMNRIISESSGQILEQNPSIRQVNLGIGGLTLVCLNSVGENRRKAEELQELVQRLENCPERYGEIAPPDFGQRIMELTGYELTETKRPEDERIYSTGAGHTFNSLVQVRVGGRTL